MNTYARSFIHALVAASVLAAGACSRDADDGPAPPAQSGAQLPTAPTAGDAAPAQGGPVRAASVAFDKPDSWRIVPAGSMRAAQLAAPGDDGDAEVVFFHFGPRGAGGVDENIARWATLVLDDDGVPDEPDVTEHTVNTLRITEVRLFGMYMSGSPAGPKTPRPSFALFGAIVQGGPEGDVFIRMTGPEDVVRAHEAAWLSMLASARAE